MRELRLWNSLSKSKERLSPQTPGHVGLYSCGPTVYARQHLGNLRAYVFADVLGRTLRAFGYTTRHVINITDVGHLTDDADAGEDKMERAAQATGQSAREVADHWTSLFVQDLERIRVEPPDTWARATDHIDEQIAMVRVLEQKGFTYETDDGVYFDTSKSPGYPAFGGAESGATRTQERIAGADAKRNPRDFALWKRSGSSSRQMEWSSPWGTGFPGWHLECSAMSSAHLGPQFDIHTGGVDHLAVHHPNEIAQSQAAFDVQPWVPLWMHGGWLMLDGAKISKSAGAAPNLDDVIAREIDPCAFRLFLLGGHYRQEMNLTLDSLMTSQARLMRFRERMQNPATSDEIDAPEALRARFLDALADDLNTPRALAVVEDAIRLPLDERRSLVEEMDAVLGIGLLKAPIRHEVSERWHLRAQLRERARSRNDYAEADAIRAELLEAGIEIEDGPEGPRLRAVSHTT